MSSRSGDVSLTDAEFVIQYAHAKLCANLGTYSTQIL